MSKAKFRGFQAKVPVQPKPKEKTLSEKLVAKYLVSVAKQNEGDSKEKAQAAREAGATVRTFFGLNEQKADELKLFEFNERYIVEYSGLTVMPVGSNAVALVMVCPYCGAEAASDEYSASFEDLGRLIYMASKGMLAPDEYHLRQCPEAPEKEKKRIGIDSPADRLVKALREVIGVTK